jgi:hypothetical protein
VLAPLIRRRRGRGLLDVQQQVIPFPVKTDDELAALIRQTIIKKLKKCCYHYLPNGQALNATSSGDATLGVQPSSQCQLIGGAVKLRLWLLISAAWIMGRVIDLIMYTLEGRFKASDLFVVPILLFGPPLALLVFGVGVGRAFRGFNIDDRASEPPARAR